MARRVAALPRTRVPAAAGTAEPQLLEAAMRALPRGPRAARREPYCKAGGGSKGAGGSDRRLGRWRTSGGVFSGVVQGPIGEVDGNRKA